MSQKFLDTFVCQANQAGVEYFFFEVRVCLQVSFISDILWRLEAFDEAWKVRRMLCDSEEQPDVHSAPGPRIWWC
jgi:hypothetical protein